MRAAAALALVLALATVARADEPRVAGDKLREALAKEPPRASLEGVLNLRTYLGLAKVGNLRLKTEIVEKGGEKLFHIEDELGIDAAGFGYVQMSVTADLGPDLSVRELVLMVWSPGSAIKNRRLAVAPEGDALVLTETKEEEKPTKRKLEGLDKRALLLTPPLGVGERLARLARGDVGTRLSFGAWDLAQGAPADLAIALDEEAAIDLRGTTVQAQKVTRNEGASVLEAWLDPKTRSVIKLSRGDGPARVTFVVREQENEAQDLPGPPPSERATEGPREAVLRFLRATGRGDKVEVAALLDADALYARAVASGKAAADDTKWKKVYEKALVGLLTSDEWRRGESLKLVTNATGKDDFIATVSGETATVRPASTPGGPAFTLRKTDGGWKITALPEK